MLLLLPSTTSTTCHIPSSDKTSTSDLRTPQQTNIMSTTSVSDPNYYTAAMSYAEWKREPTLWQTFFGLQLPYRPPRSAIGKFFWRRRLWVEVTFALSMLEPWEKFLVCTCLDSCITAP